MSAILNLAMVAPGTRLLHADGRTLVVIDNPKDGTWLVCRDEAGDPEDEQLVSALDIAGHA